MGPFELLQKIVEVFECLHISYLVTGSVAAMAYGESRLTNDIDMDFYKQGCSEKHLRTTIHQLLVFYVRFSKCIIVMH